MKSNIKKKSKYGISILTIALILIMIPTGLAAVTADRSIESNTLTVGNSTNVTVDIKNNGLETSLSLKESIPSGWTLARGLDEADQFKSLTNEWVWFAFPANLNQNVTYKLTVPSNAAAGDYNIGGNITANGSTTKVAGANTITVVNNTVVPPVQDSFEFIVSPSSSIVNVGENALYTLTISNTGSASDTYDLVAKKPTNATVSLDQNIVTVGPGSSSTVILTVSGSTIGSYSVNVTATSGANTSNTKSVTTKTDVVITPAAPEGFNFDVTPTTLTVNIGASATYTLTVSNTGSTEDTYNLVADKPANTTVSLGNNSVTIGAGNNSAITILVNGSVTGTYTVGVTAKSQANASNVKNVTTTTNVVLATAPPSSGGGSGRSGGSSGGGTYPTFTATPVKTSNATAGPTVAVTTVVPTVTTTVVRPTSAIAETPVDMTTTKKGAPGFEIIVAIGMFALVFILRKMK